LTRRIVLDEHISRCSQRSDLASALGAGWIDGPGAFPTIQVQEQAGPLGVGYIVGERPERSARIPSWRLELDHLGTLIG
jgi:hypothetical protein